MIQKVASLSPPVLVQQTRTAVLAWVLHELREVARHFQSPRVFAIGDVVSIAQRRNPGLTLVNAGGTLADVMHGMVPPRGLALAYVADVVAYLNDDLARRVVRALFGCLAPGGRLLLASYCGLVTDLEYEAACADWSVVARDPAKVMELLSRVPQEEIARIDRFHDSSGSLSFIRIVRR